MIGAVTQIMALCNHSILAMDVLATWLARRTKEKENVQNAEETTKGKAEDKWVTRQRVLSIGVTGD